MAACHSFTLAKQQLVDWIIALLSSEHVPWRMVSRAAEKVVNVGGDFSMASTVEQGERPPLAVGIS